MKENINKINFRINEEYCEETTNKLTDENLLEEYKNQQSVKKQINDLTNLLKKHNISDETNMNIIKDYTPKFQPELKVLFEETHLIKLLKMKFIA
jgi:hypothetical protein